MSTFSPDRMIFMIENNKAPNTGVDFDLGFSTLFVPHINFKNTIKLSDAVIITDREQTVVDMIRYHRHEFHLYETILSAYDDGVVGIARLESLALDYGITKEMLQDLYNKAEQVYEEDNE